MSIEIKNHTKYMTIENIGYLYEYIPETGIEISKMRYFFKDIVNDNKIITDTIELLTLLKYTNFIEDCIYLTLPKKKSDCFYFNLVKDIIDYCFSHNIILSTKKLIIEEDYLAYPKNSFSLKYFALRNLLLTNSILFEKGSFYVINYKYHSFFSKALRKKNRKMNLEQLKEKLLNDEILGEKAEYLVMKYEENRLNTKKPICISGFDVAAGYDIKSFTTDSARTFDMFIEVKCFSNSKDFFWSKNEIEHAKKYKDEYYLYLVSATFNKKPIIIRNPYKKLYLNSSIYRECQSMKFSLDAVYKEENLNF